MSPGFPSPFLSLSLSLSLFLFACSDNGSKKGWRLFVRFDGGSGGGGDDRGVGGGGEDFYSMVQGCLNEKCTYKEEIRY